MALFRSRPTGSYYVHRESILALPWSVRREYSTYCKMFVFKWQAQRHARKMNRRLRRRRTDG